MDIVDGAGNYSGIVENRGGTEPNRSGRNMTEAEVDDRNRL